MISRSLRLNENSFRPILQTWKPEKSGFQFVLQSKHRSNLKVTESVMTSTIQTLLEDMHLKDVHVLIQQTIDQLPAWKNRVKVVDFPFDSRMRAVVLIYAKDDIRTPTRVWYQTLLLTDTHDHVPDGQVISRATLAMRAFDDDYRRRVKERVQKTCPKAHTCREAGFFTADSKDYQSDFNRMAAVESSLLLFLDVC